jgi:hypothetical protein
MHVNSTSGLGTAIPLVSEAGNHPPSSWAHATAQIIFDIAHVASDRQRIAHDLQQEIAKVLTRHYAVVIEREQDNLETYPDYCDTRYQIDPHVWYALDEIRHVVLGSPFEFVILSEPWQDAAAATIGDHLTTAVHVERLLYADRHPDNVAAVAYQRHFTSK